jgi:NADH-quinone oxidoreductase subunit L
MGIESIVPFLAAGEPAAAASVPAWLVWMVPLLPMSGFLFQVFVGRKLPKPVAGLVSCALVAVAGLISLQLWYTVRTTGVPVVADLARWIHVPGLDGGALAVIANHKLVVDQLTSVMILVITNIGFFIHWYSTAYMAEEKRFSRYFSYLNLFTGFMLILVMGGNLLLMFVGWEGVGLCSYLLIGFWFEKNENALAGMKAFVVNRVGDWAFTIGALTLFVFLGTLQDPATGKYVGKWTVDFGEIKSVVTANPDLVAGVATFVGIMLFIGATGKSAQVPLYVWLPDAMAGPTPVSALIHAATMVTAGVYMIARLNFLFVLSPTAMCTVATVGAFTALFAGTIGVAQNDIKKVLAYSTVSQLGFMFLGVGVGAFTAGVFHLFTHACFKACLFLGSGSVIHGMGGEQDIRKMGGLKAKMPITFWTFALASVAIAGIPPLAGFFSKDEILWMTFTTHAFAPWWGKVLWLMGAVAAAFTAFYMTRLVILTFLGRPKWGTQTAFSGGGKDLPDWADDESLLDLGAMGRKKKPELPAEDHAHLDSLPQDESLLDMSRATGSAAPAPGHDEARGHGRAQGHDAPDDAPAHAGAPAAGHGHDDHDAGHGGGHGHGHSGEPHESPFAMWFALAVLAGASCVVGFLGVPHFNLFERWLEPVFGPTEHAKNLPLEFALMIFSTLVAAGSIYAAWVVYGKRKGVPAQEFVEKHKELYELVRDKYRVDELYQATVLAGLIKANEGACRFDNEVVDAAVNGTASLSATLSKGMGVVDNEVVDGAVNGAAVATQAAAKRVRRAQTGNIKDYLAVALVGALFVIAFFCLVASWDRLVALIS